jgi:hypothetical protein
MSYKDFPGYLVGPDARYWFLRSYGVVVSPGASVHPVGHEAERGVGQRQASS